MNKNMPLLAEVTTDHLGSSIFHLSSFSRGEAGIDILFVHLVSLLPHTKNMSIKKDVSFEIN